MAMFGHAEPIMQLPFTTLLLTQESECGRVRVHNLHRRKLLDLSMTVEIV
jgi:hypothetical protein